MTQEEKQLLLVDLCARSPYGVCVNLPNHHLVSHKYVIYDINIRNGWTIGILDCAGRIQIYSAKVEDIKPYLRPMSSMTDGELIEFLEIRGRNLNSEELRTFRKGETAIVSTLPSYSRHIDWLNEHHFDYRGLIDKGLAIEVNKENNPYKE